MSETDTFTAPQDLGSNAGRKTTAPWLALDIRHQFASLHLRLAFELHAVRTVVFGPSGSGKSSLLRAIAGLLEPDAGSIAIQGSAIWQRSSGSRSALFISAEKRRVGLVMQNPAIFPHRTAAGNVAFALRGMDKAAQAKKIRQLLELVEAGPLADRWPRELSGGQLQRIAIARTLAAEPSILLLDEPFAALDAHSRQQISRNLQQWTQSHNIPVMMVTHNLEEAFSAGDEVLSIEDGTLIAQGLPGQVLAEHRARLLRELGASDKLYDAAT